MKNQNQNPVNPNSFWANQMGRSPQPAAPHQVSGNGFPQGPAFHHPGNEDDWRDGNGY